MGSLTKLSAAVLCLCLCGGAYGASQMEDFTVDPGWTGNGNTAYGYSGSTNNAGGAVGEAGGAVPSRTVDITWYADTDLGGSLTQLEPFSATGRFTISPRTDFDGGFAIGFFDTNGSLNTDDGHIEQGAYFRVLDGDGAAYRALPALAGNRPSTSEPAVTTLEGDVDYLFNLNYNPTGGGADIGRLTLEIRLAADNTLVESATSIDVSNTLGHTYNAFGIQTGDFDRVEPSSNAFIDDLTYTVVPEPASAALLALAGLTCLKRRRR